MAGEVRSRGEQGTNRVVDEMRRMIMSGELLPGQQVRQESMAAALGVSRLPVREALRELASDGLVKHTPNAGYAVVRLSEDEFDQIYLMRRLLETQVIQKLPKPTKQQLTKITALHRDIIAAAKRMDLTEMRMLNFDFHFMIFRLSPLTLFVNQIEKLWTWGMPYQAVYLYDPNGRSRVIQEHTEMISALRAGDKGRLIMLMDEHRRGPGTQLNLMLHARPQAGPHSA